MSTKDSKSKGPSKTEEDSKMRREIHADETFQLKTLASIENRHQMTDGEVLRNHAQVVLSSTCESV